jgi:ribosomal protein L11 methyltransferase
LTQDDWTAIRVRTTTDSSAVISALFEAGAESVQEVDDGVMTHLRGVDRARISEALRAADSAALVEFSATPAVDWTREWRTRITAHSVGRLVVAPPWLAHEYPDGIIIDPGMAFGTGEHETTRGILRLMQNVVRPGDVVADLGAGSAVLGIAAAKLGAARVAAIEIDPDAIGNAEENVARNGVADRVTVIEGDAALLLALVAPVRVVVANIVSSVLETLLPGIRSALLPDGAALLGGILAEERTDMEGALARLGWAIVATDEEGSWWSASITPR